MTKKLLLIFTLLLSVFAINANDRLQRNNFDFDKFKAEKIAFFTDIMELTSDEAQRFWPVYNEFERKKWEIIQQRNNLYGNIDSNLTTMNNNELIEFTKKLASFNSLEGKLDEEYNEKFLEILHPQKVVKLFKAEINFRNNMLRNYRRGEHKK